MVGHPRQDNIQKRPPLKVFSRASWGCRPLEKRAVASATVAPLGRWSVGGGCLRSGRRRGEQPQLRASNKRVAGVGGGGTSVAFRSATSSHCSAAAAAVNNHNNNNIITTTTITTVISSPT